MISIFVFLEYAIGSLNGSRQGEVAPCLAATDTARSDSAVGHSRSERQLPA